MRGLLIDTWARTSAMAKFPATGKSGEPRGEGGHRRQRRRTRLRHGDMLKALKQMRVLLGSDFRVTALALWGGWE